MEIEFYKYHGNGNDFILIDNREPIKQLYKTELLNRMCHRRFGIGADGVILLENSADHDFKMKYYNADGRESSMCGNGGRCIVKFAQLLGLIDKTASFAAIDGIHQAKIEEDGQVNLKMNDVSEIEMKDGNFVLDTGSPHYVQFVEQVSRTDVYEKGKEIRNQASFKANGINVNFVEINGKQLKARTYERGVEDETLSCGTGVVATALVGALKLEAGNGESVIRVNTSGGDFEVSFEKIDDQQFKNIWLKGGATFVFQGRIDLAWFKQEKKGATK